jgi:hypothetical protein
MERSGTRRELRLQPEMVAPERVERRGRKERGWAIREAQVREREVRPCRRWVRRVVYGWLEGGRIGVDDELRYQWDWDRGWSQWCEAREERMVEGVVGQEGLVSMAGWAAPMRR